MAGPRFGLILLLAALTTGCAGSGPLGASATLTTTPLSPSASAPAPVSASIEPSQVRRASAAPTSASASSRAPVPSTTTSDGGIAGAIPWLDDPTPVAYPPPYDQPVTHPALYRACTASDLTASTQGWGAAMGMASQRITLTDVADTPCSLTGQPSALHHTTRDGAVVSVALQSGGYGRDLDATANLRPGKSGYTDVTAGGNCLGFQHPLPVVSSTLELPDGTRLPVADSSKTSAPPSSCVISASSFGTAHVPVPEPTYPLDPLRVTLLLPPSVRAGQMFDFAVTLTNPTSAAVPLTPCPTYQEVWKPIGKVTPPIGSYRLNCRRNSSIAAGQSLTFAMRMVAPDRALTDWFSWWLYPSAHVGAGAMLPVVASPGSDQTSEAVKDQ